MIMSKPNWFLKKEKELSSTGKLDLSNEFLKDLSIVGSRTSLKILDLSFTSIKSFKGLSYQPKLEYIILNGSTISSFQNVSSISNISKISLLNTPVSKIPNYKLSLLLVCKNLRIINGKIIPESIKKKVQFYPSIVSKLVDAGWIVDYPCPNSETIRNLCDDYNVNFDFLSSPINSQFNSNDQKDFFDNMINEYSIRHKELFQHINHSQIPDHYCSMSVTDSNHSFSGSIINEDSNEEYDIEELPSLVTKIIQSYGFTVERGDPRKNIILSLKNIFSYVDDHAFKDEVETAEQYSSLVNSDYITDSSNINKYLDQDDQQKTESYLYNYEEEEESLSDDEIINQEEKTESNENPLDEGSMKEEETLFEREENNDQLK